MPLGYPHSSAGSLEFVGSFAVGWPVAAAAAAAVGFAGSFVEFPWLRVSPPVVEKQQPVAMRLFLDAAVAATAATVVAAAIAVVVAVAVAVAVAAAIAAAAAVVVVVVAVIAAAVVATVAVVGAAGSRRDSFPPSTLEDP